MGTKIQKRSERKHVFTFFHFEKNEKVRFGICNYQERTFSKSFVWLLLLRSLTVAAHELIDTTCGVNELALTSIELAVDFVRNISPLDMSLNTTGR